MFDIVLLGTYQYRTFDHLLRTIDENVVCGKQQLTHHNVSIVSLLSNKRKTFE
jgi:hypothetical protein